MSAKSAAQSNLSNARRHTRRVKNATDIETLRRETAAALEALARAVEEVAAAADRSR
jgi:hypothetical protein